MTVFKTAAEAVHEAAYRAEREHRSMVVLADPQGYRVEQMRSQNYKDALERIQPISQH